MAQLLLYPLIHEEEEVRQQLSFVITLHIL